MIYFLRALYFGKWQQHLLFNAQQHVVGKTDASFQPKKVLLLFLHSPVSSLVCPKWQSVRRELKSKSDLWLDTPGRGETVLATKQTSRNFPDFFSFTGGREYFTVVTIDLIS